MTYEYPGPGTSAERLFAAVKVEAGLEKEVARAIALHQRRLGCAPDTVRLGVDLAPGDSPEIHGLQVEITTALSHPRREVWAYRQQSVNEAAV